MELVEIFEAAKKAADAAAQGGGSPEESRCVDALKRLRKMPVTMDVLVKTQVTLVLYCSDFCCFGLDFISFIFFLWWRFGDFGLMR